jgi:hypothetical protein
MSKQATKTTAELTKLLEQKVELDARVNQVWQRLRLERIAAIRGDDDPGELPVFVGLDEMQRASQAKTEARERENRAITMSPQHQAALRDLNSAA